MNAQQRRSRLKSAREKLLADIADSISEDDLQRAVIELFQLNRWWITHIPGGGADERHRLRMARLGYQPGTPDLIAVSPDGELVFLELKTRKGRPSPEQLAVHDALRERGQRVCIVRSLEDAQEIIGLPFTNPNQHAAGLTIQRRQS